MTTESNKCCGTCKHEKDGDCRQVGGFKCSPGKYELWEPMEPLCRSCTQYPCGASGGDGLYSCDSYREKTAKTPTGDLLNSYRMAFAMTSIVSKMEILKAMEDNGLGGAALEIKRDFGGNFAAGLKAAYDVEGR